MAAVWICGLQNVLLVPTGESEGSGKSPACYVSIRHVPFLCHPSDEWERSWLLSCHCHLEL